MVSEVRRDDDGAGSAELREEAFDALREARRLLDYPHGWPPVETLEPVIERLTRVEVALAEKNESDLSQVVFVVLGIMFAVLCRTRNESASSGSKERAEALRRLRWADRNGPPADLIVVQARMMLVFLLAPWALPRPDGSRTALGAALFAAVDRRVLTEALRRDLAEAKDVVDRVAEASLPPEIQQTTARIQGEIERMLAPDSASPAPEEAHATDEAHASQDAEVLGEAGTPESVLLDVVRGLLALAGARSTPQFTRVLVWLTVELQSKAERPTDRSLYIVDPEASALLGQAAVGRAAGAVDGIRRGADLALDALRALPPDAPEQVRVARLHAYLLLTAEFLEPGSVDFGTVRRPTPEPDDGSGDRLDDWPISLPVEPGLVPHLDSFLRDFVAHLGMRERRMAAWYDRLLSYRTGDHGYLEDAATLLGEALEASDADSWWALALRVELTEVLEQAASRGGSHQDADVSLAARRELGAALESDGSLPPDAPLILDLALSAADGELRHAQRTGDHEELPRLIEKLRALYAGLPADSTMRDKLAERLSRLEKLRADGERVTGRAAPQAVGPAGPVDTGEPVAERASLDREVAELRRKFDEPETYHEQEYDRRAHLGLRLLLAVVRGDKDPALLDEAITELTRVRALIAEGRGVAQRVDVLTKLAEAHVIRAARRGPHADADRRAFVDITREALAELAADVLLQLGADHGLSAALNGSLLARRLALVDHRIGRPADTVADLEKGRALVLQAAFASRSIPELLDAVGHSELARQWRAQVPANPLRPTAEDASPPAAHGTPIPSALRRRALAALGVRPGAGAGPGIRHLVGAADVAQLTAGLAATGTEALVYLVPGAPVADASMPGYALILRPGAGRPAFLPLPELTTPGSEPLERYLDAAAERSRALTDPNLHASWRAAWEAHWQVTLDELCEWAWKAVMGPVLAAVRPLLAAQGPLARPPRIVLVPCGPLGVVPWHAARIRGLGAHGHRYACQEAVLSYAPSGTQFLAAAARRRMSPSDGRQVLVADPQLTLPWAEMEAAALRAGCYPDALRYGEFVTTGVVPDAAGTPAELLAVLPGGASPASVVHLSCHALAAPRPTGSALWLAAPPGAGPDAGRLTVADIFDGATGRRPDAGPLVVLSGCETDLSTRHHDEALTLATVLVAGGAADVVGSRWAVRDGPTAVMMAVFHHHLTVGGLAPPDALRAAQLWMLNPYRELPPTLDGPLRHEATRPDLHRIHHWAAFTHQGNPASAATG
ncbi:CHAT domain-containing protein [Streptomyces fulvoviolaceus]|uniref:CHAT domain-containing protein n=1 Tax=Streptomyces fulvoviolaceus TaxID=285535 RepID=UPI0021C23436|nr:CHAT domain-containing protein [Streptomyces fulvoviolaceus]MCT9076001.1 CHAT domain-containing protein [Streptomyces fulvoviolaceus]